MVQCLPCLPADSPGIQIQGTPSPQHHHTFCTSAGLKWGTSTKSNVFISQAFIWIFDRKYLDHCPHLHVCLSQCETADRSSSINKAKLLYRHKYEFSYFAIYTPPFSLDALVVLARHNVERLVDIPNIEVNINKPLARTFTVSFQNEPSISCHFAINH